MNAPESLSDDKVKCLEPILNDLQKYIEQQVSFDSELSDDEPPAIKNLLEPKPDDLNIAFVNRQLEPLKELLPKIKIPITPANMMTLLKPSYYKSVDEKTTDLVLIEIEQLTQKPFLMMPIKPMSLGNGPWISSVSLKISLKKKRKNSGINLHKKFMRESNRPKKKDMQML